MGTRTLFEQLPYSPKNNSCDGYSNYQSQPAEAEENEWEYEIKNRDAIKVFHEMGWLMTIVCGLSSIVYFIDHIIIFMDCNGIILVQKCAKFGKFARGVGSGDPGLIYGSDFDNETRFCSLQVVHKVCAQSLNIRMRNMVIEIKIKDIGRGDARAGFEHGKQCAARPIKRLDGVATRSVQVLFEEAGNLCSAVGGSGDGFVLELAEKGLGGKEKENNKDGG